MQMNGKKRSTTSKARAPRHRERGRLQSTTMTKTASSAGSPPSAARSATSWTIGRLRMAAVVMAAVVVHQVAAETPRYDAGVSYTGLCTDTSGRVLPHYFRAMASPDDTPQQGLDSCYEAYGDKVIGFSFDSGFGTGEYSCYFDPNDMPVIAGGWSVGYESSDADPPVGGGNGSPASICYNFRAQTCSSRIVAAVDRTYTFKYPGPAIQVARSAYRMVAFLINALPFDEDVRFGLLDIDRTSIDWRVDLDDAAATDPTLLLEDVFRAHASLNAGSRALGSKFPPVFTSVAEKVVSESAEIPSYIVLVSDGVLLHPSRWRNYAKLKQRMLNRLGDAAPKVICYRMYRLQNTKFFDAVCDETFYAGMDGKSLTEITEDIAAEICPLLGDDNGDGPGASDGSELGASSTSRESVDMQPVVDRGPNDA